MRFLFYSHDGLGLGHVRRNIAIATALTDAADVNVLLANGADEVDRLGVPKSVDVLKLPGVRKTAAEGYAGRHLTVPGSDVRQLRARLLEAAVEGFRPDVLVADKHPLGVNGELRPALDRLRELGGRAVLGLRDILDDAVAVRRDWAVHDVQGAIAANHDLVLVYGREAVHDPIAAYGLEAMRGRARYCGYVTMPRRIVDDLPPFPRRSGRRVVLGTPGGGEDGFALLAALLEASRGAPWDAVVVTGPQACEGDRRALAALARDVDATLVPFVPDLCAWFPDVGAVVCMGGYNTLTEAAAAGVPTVCVPRVMPRTEQLIRARAFERLGLLQCVEPGALTPATLRAAVERALLEERKGRAERAGGLLGLNGAKRAAEHLLARAGRSASTATATAAAG